MIFFLLCSFTYFTLADVSRTWTVNDARDDRLRLRGPADDGTDEIRIRTEVSTDNDEAFRYRIDYYPDTVNASGFKTEFTVKVMNPIQFDESGNTPGYQPSEDTLISHQRGTPAPLEWSTSDPGFFTWNTTFSNALGMRGHLSDNTAQLNAVQSLSANELKFDLWVDSLIWDALASHLAFHLKIECESDDVPIDQTQSNNFVVGSVLGGPDGFFSWATNVDTFQGPLNSGVAVSANLLFTQNGTELYYTIDTTSKPPSVMWDPLAGLEIISGAGRSTDKIVGIVFGVLFVIGFA